jgi:RNA polymerase sigma-70 factor (ECF subfamily)
MQEAKDQPSDSELAADAANGCLKSMESLFLRHEQRLHRFLYSRMQDHALAEDLLQETFIIVCRKIHRYNPRYAFTTWLFTIANRLAASAWRKHRPTEQIMPGIEDSSPGPASVAEANEKRENLWSSARELLNDSQYAALWLHYGEDLPVRDIALTLGKTTPGVKVLLHRARKKLASSLDHHPHAHSHATSMKPVLSTS